MRALLAGIRWAKKAVGSIGASQFCWAAIYLFLFLAAHANIAPQRDFSLASALTTVFGAAFLVQLILITRQLLKFLHSMNWRPGLCKSCHYDLSGNQSGICPECGEEIQRDPPR